MDICQYNAPANAWHVTPYFTFIIQFHIYTVHDLEPIICFMSALSYGTSYIYLYIYIFQVCYI